METFTISSYTSSFNLPEKVIYPSAWTGHIPFAYFLVEFIKPKVIVELGVHNGSSYSAFCESVKRLGLTTACFAIDTWEGEKQAGYYSSEIYQELSSDHAIRFPNTSTLLRTTFDEALAKFENNSIDILHIDGLHTYYAVKHDYETWVTKVKEGGVILFHDTQVKKTDFGVWKLWNELTSNNQPSIEFTHSHGLGVLLKGRNPIVEAFLKEVNQNPYYKTQFEFLGNQLLKYAYLKKHTDESYLYTTVKKLELEIVELHAKAERMRIKNRLKRLLGLYRK